MYIPDMVKIVKKHFHLKCPIFAGLGQHKSFANSSREEILDFLDVMSSEGKVPPADSFPSLEELNEDEEQVLVLILTVYVPLNSY